MYKIIHQKSLCFSHSIDKVGVVADEVINDRALSLCALCHDVI